LVAAPGEKRTPTFVEPPAGITPNQVALKPLGQLMLPTVRGELPVLAIVNMRLLEPPTVTLPKAKSPVREITLVGMRAKLAASVIGAVMVIEAGLLLPEYDPPPLPVQAPKLNPSEGVAPTVTTAPLLVQPLPGLTLPPAPALVVR
jgi:hypothetical protein